MSSSRLMTRRRLAGLLAWLAAGLSSAAFAQDPIPSEGEGEDPAAPLPKDKRTRDRGVGGTGVIGTIRQFGSIIVNDLRIAYPKDVSVVIDGTKATAAALRIGHVVQVVAQRGGGQLSTAHISISSEVIGPVEVASATMLTVLGQSVLLDDIMAGEDIRPGDRLAVSGLRRVDGTIVASRIERRRGSRVQVAGLVQMGPDGVVRVGQLAVQGVGQVLLGRRAVLVGSLIEGVLYVTGSRADTDLLDDPTVEYVSMEAYAERQGGKVVFGSGVQPTGTDAHGAIPEGREVHVFADMQRGDDGGLGIGGARVAGAPPREGEGPHPRHEGFEHPGHWHEPGGRPPGEMRGPGGPGGPPGGPHGPGGPGGPGGPHGPGGPGGPGGPHGAPGGPAGPGAPAAPPGAAP